MPAAPIAYIIFNRPRHTLETFSAIRKQQPSKLFIIADGPRQEHVNDVERCRKVREIVEQVDWPCDVHRNYAEQNMGLKRRVSTGLDWVFSYVDRAIVLEDDCLPHPDFFLFCDSLLERYRANERVWVITGDNFQHGRKRGKATYYFSKYNHCWGWATWRRAWQHYLSGLPFWPEWKYSADWISKTPDRVERNYWSKIFDNVEQGAIDSWAYPWTACVWYHGGLTATPNVNLVTNIGIGPQGTHTVSLEDQKGISVYPLGELTHPEKIIQDQDADRYVFDHHFGGSNLRIHNRLKRFPKIIWGNLIKKSPRKK